MRKGYWIRRKRKKSDLNFMLLGINSLLKMKLDSSFLKTISLTTLVKAGGMVFGILVSISIGRFLGAKGLGIINLSNQIAGIIGMLIFLGIPAVIVKETSIAYSNNNWHRIRDIIYTSLRINLPIAILLIGMCYLLFPWLIDTFFEKDLKNPLIIITTAILFQVISKSFASSLNGCRKIWQSSLVGDALSAVFVGIGIFSLFIFELKITIIRIAFFYAIARLLVAIIITFYWKKVSRVPSEDTKRKFISKSLLKVALPLLFVQATNTIANSVDSLMIGSFLTIRDVGLYAVAFKIAFVSSFFLMVTNAVLAPRIASFYANNELDKLEDLIQKVTGILSSIGIVSLVLIIFGGPFILNVWGVEFSEAYYPLIILSVGQFFNISAGSVGLILTMCDQEKKWGYVTLGSVILNALLNISLIQIWGISGAALATAINMVALNFVGLIIIKKKIGISTIPSFK